MVEKDTQEFSRESFKDKILRQLEENSQKQAAVEALPETERDYPGIFLKNLNSQEEVSKETEKASEFPKSKEEMSEKEREFLKATSEPFKASERKLSLSEKLAALDVQEPKTRTTAQAVTPTRTARVRQLDKVENTENEQETPTKRSRNRTTNDKKKAPTVVKKKKKNTAGKIIAVIVLVLVLAAGGTGWYGYNFIKAGVQPLNSSDKTMKAINIPAGASSKEIGNLLQKQGIIKNGMIFQYYTKFKNYTGFKSGYYNLAPNMTLSYIATELEKGGTQKPVAPVLGKITIPEGYTLAQMSKAITVNADEKNGKTPFTTAEFMKVVQDPTFIAEMKKDYPNLFASLPDKASGVKYQLEGYLFPATYDYTKNSNMESIVESMIAAMNTQLTPYYSKISSEQMTVNEVLSLAALTEKEANNDDDRRNVAGTFYNRLNAGMKLESNTSILYAEGKLGAQTTLKQDATIDTNLNSPYNLYMNTGTGPGPIDNPSLSSIKAVMDPAQNDYLFFVADVTTGKVYFAKNLEEQNENVQKYVNDELKK
ncbi:endolytic transglycosylase MltG [Lactococcus nasutitermitis]|uniref:Endolytic murein transglycosylase n=1 Tax=Lactococcus nasutitermitis TaxID=1652957 RepID=A0ABV9JDA5_9LACT|nr:endolytic transglycosylase MltG [Lactococcus nasutitermitis]